MNVFKTFNRYAPFKSFKTLEKTAPIGSALHTFPIVSSTFNNSTIAKGFRRSSCCFVPELQRIFVSACDGLSDSKQLERLEHLEPLELLKSVRLHGGN